MLTTYFDTTFTVHSFIKFLWLSSMCMRSLFEQDIKKIVNFCSQYHENFPNTVILLVSVNIYIYIILWHQNNKWKSNTEYSTHYVPEKYKQQFIVEITVLEIQSTVPQQKWYCNRDIWSFSTRARGSGHQVSLAKWPRGPRFTEQS